MSYRSATDRARADAIVIATIVLVIVFVVAVLTAKWWVR